MKSRRAGFVLISSAAAMIGLLVLVGLGIDVGRLYVARGELQVYADEAAVAAALELDGTAAGLTRAQNAASRGPGAGVTPNLWNLGTAQVTGVISQFSAAAGGPYDSNPASAAGVRYARVSVSGSLNLYFLPLAAGIGGTQTATVSATAGQNRRSSLGDGLAPFSPMAHDTADANFGFSAGLLYTLRWAPGGQRNKPGGSCSGDVGYDPGSSSERGYLDVGQGTGSSALRAAVVNSSYFLPLPLSSGSALTMYTGQDSVTSAMQTRFSQDTDTGAPNFASYNGNGRRLLMVPVSNSGATPTVVGFALFFMQPVPCGTQNTTPCCAEYVGPAVLGSHHKGAGPPGLYTVQLIQ